MLSFFLRRDVTFISDFNDWFGRVTRVLILHVLGEKRLACIDSKDDRRCSRETVVSLMRQLIIAILAREHAQTFIETEENILAINQIKIQSLHSCL